MPPLIQASITYSLGLYASALFYDKEGKLLRKLGHEDPSKEGYLVRVERAKLRDWLAHNLDIEHGKRFQRFEEHEAGVTAFFEDGTSAAGSVLVGADGTNSVVRHQLLPQSSGINYLPVACIIGGAAISKELYERQLRLAHSYHLAFGEDCRFVTLIGSIAEDKQTAWYYWVVNWIDEDVATADNWLKPASAEERLDLAKKKCAGIDPSLLEVLEATQPQGMEVYIPVRDLLPSAIPEGRITLLGDAFHPMTFFNGEGGNHAMQDALDLGKLLQEDAFARHHLYSGQKAVDWVQLLTKYYEKALPRGKEAVVSNREAALEHSRGSRGKLAGNTYPTMSTEVAATLANSKS